MKHLIVTADDFGLDLSVNEAVERAHREGILTAASLMVAEAGAGDAVRRARAMPGLGVGLHLALADARPCLPPERIPALVGPDGRFRTNVAAAGARWFFDPAARAQLKAEIEAQFAAFAATGLAFDHVDAHKHLHHHPTVLGHVLRLAKQYGVPAVRVPFEPGHAVPIVTSSLARRVARAGLRGNDRVYGLAWTGAVTENRVLELLIRLPDGTSELYTHPATEDARPASVPGYRYVDELAMLTSPAVRDAVAASGAVLTCYGARRA